MTTRPPKSPPARRVEVDARGMRSWHPTVQQVRDCALNWLVTGADFVRSLGLEAQAALFVPTQDEVENVAEMARDAVTAGRFIDCGHLPNAALSDGGQRGGTMYNHRAFGPPFRDPWILYHTWDGLMKDGSNPMGVAPDGRLVAVYLVQTMDEDKGDLEVCELCPLAFSATHRVLLIGDRGIVQPDPEDQARKYRAICAPAQWRFGQTPDLYKLANFDGTPGAAAAGNLFDPLMTVLLMLNTRGVVRERIEAPAKLQRARLRSRKPPIPSYERIDTAAYVTALLARRHRTRGEALGGHHASPVPHIRMGHLREYAPGKRTFVRDTLVNVSDAERREAFRRSHYRIIEPTDEH